MKAHLDRSKLLKDKETQEQAAEIMIILSKAKDLLLETKQQLSSPEIIRRNTDKIALSK